MPAEFSAASLQAHFAAISKRFAAVEAQLALLSEKAGVPYTPASAGVPADVVELVKAGKEMDALKRYREVTGATMEEAREAIAGL